MVTENTNTTNVLTSKQKKWLEPCFDLKIDSDAKPKKGMKKKFAKV